MSVKGILENQEQSYNVDVEISDASESELSLTSDGQTIDIEATVVKGYTGNNQIFISPTYENLFIGGINHDVEVLSPSRVLVPVGSKINIRVTTRV